MEKAKLKEMTKEQLVGREKSLKGFILLFISIIIGLFYFVLIDYFNGSDLDFSMLTIAICTLGGPAVLYPELKEVRKELNNRN